MSEDAAIRETGAQKAIRQCPQCGAEMVVTESPYGSVTAYCPNHETPITTEQAAEQSLPRETGTDIDHG